MSMNRALMVGYEVTGVKMGWTQDGGQEGEEERQGGLRVREALERKAGFAAGSRVYDSGRRI